MKPELIKQFQLEALFDIINGEDINNLHYIMREFEKEEAFEECAGIKKALDSALCKTIDELEIEYLELINKNHER